MPAALAPLLFAAALGPADARPAAGSAAAPVRFESFTMRDQFNKTHVVGGESDGVTVLLYGDRDAAEGSRALGEALQVRFHPAAEGKPISQAALTPVRPVPGAPAGSPAPPVRVVPAACAAGVPVAIRRVILFQLRRAAPETPVWMDWNENLKTRFGQAPAKPNAVVISADGVARPVDVRGADEEAVARVERVVETMRREMLAGR